MVELSTSVDARPRNVLRGASPHLPPSPATPLSRQVKDSDQFAQTAILFVVPGIFSDFIIYVIHTASYSV